MATGLFIVAGIVVDLGQARDVRRQSQNASDASALAAANVLYTASGHCTSPSGALSPCNTDAVNAAMSYSATNFDVATTDWTSCTDAGHFFVPPSGTECVSFTDDSLGGAQPTQPTRVRVRSSRVGRSRVDEEAPGTGGVDRCGRASQNQRKTAGHPYHSGNWEAQ